MSSDKIIFKNTTGTDIGYKEFSINVPASSQIAVTVSEYPNLGNDTAIAEISPDINSGDIVINDGVNDLSAADGIRLISHQFKIYIKKDGADVVRVNTSLDFVGSNLSVTDDGNGKASIRSNPQNSTLGKETGYQYFNNGSNVKNKWLDHEGSNISCDNVPGIIPASSRMRAITFTNINSNSDIDVEVYKNGTSPGDLVFTWEIRDCRSAWKLNGLSGVTFSPGDELRIFFKDVGGQIPAKPVIKIILINTDDLETEGCNATLL